MCCALKNVQICTWVRPKKHFKVVTFYTYVALLVHLRDKVYRAQANLFQPYWAKIKKYLQLQNSVHF